MGAEAMMMPMRPMAGLGFLGAAPQSFAPGERYGITGPTSGVPLSVAAAQAAFDLAFGSGKSKAISVTSNTDGTSTVVLDWLAPAATLASLGYTGTPGVTISDLGVTPTASGSSMSPTVTYVAVGAGVLVVGGILWWLAARQKKANAAARELGESLDNPILDAAYEEDAGEEEEEEEQEESDEAPAPIAIGAAR